MDSAGGGRGLERCEGGRTCPSGEWNSALILVKREDVA